MALSIKEMDENIPNTSVPSGGKGLALRNDEYITEPAKWSGQEITYEEIVADVTISATVEASADTIISTDSIEYDGNPILIEFFAPRVTPFDSDTALVAITLWQDTTDMGRIWLSATVAAMNAGPSGVYAARRLTPSKGPHVYSVRGFRTVGSGVVNAGGGGAGNHIPAFIRITRAGRQSP